MFDFKRRIDNFYIMGRKKIEKAPKKTKAEKKEETESEHEE